MTDTLPETAVPQNIQFGTNITLVGYTLSETPSAPGRPLCTTLYWQVETAITTNYTVFLHFVDTAGYVHTQRDNSPAFGFYPIDHWQPAEIVGDMHCIQMPTNLAPDSYGINVGIYDASSGQRLPISGGGFEPDAGALRLTQVDILR